MFSILKTLNIINQNMIFLILWGEKKKTLEIYLHIYVEDNWNTSD